MTRSAPVVFALLCLARVAVAQDAPETPASAEVASTPIVAEEQPPASAPVTAVTEAQPASSPVRPPPGPGATFEYANTWDVNIEGGIGSTLSPGKLTGFGRVRGGVLMIRDNIHAMAGVTVELSNLAPITFGIQAEILHLEWGLWLQAGAMIDTKPRPGFMVATGYSIVGFEVQYRDFGPQNGAGPYQWAMFAKLRLPIRHIVRIFTGK